MPRPAARASRRAALRNIIGVTDTRHRMLNTGRRRCRADLNFQSSITINRPMRLPRRAYHARRGSSPPRPQSVLARSVYGLLQTTNRFETEASPRRPHCVGGRAVPPGHKQESGLACGRTCSSSQSDDPYRPLRRSRSTFETRLSWAAARPSKQIVHVIGGVGATVKMPAARRCRR